MDNALVRFISLAPKDVIDLICNYLDFSDFLSLTSVSRFVRSVLVNHHLFWMKYYMKRVSCRKYEDYRSQNPKSPNKYELRMPSFDRRKQMADPANRLLNSARKVDIMKTESTLSSNPMLNLGILDNFKRSRWKGQFKQYTENLSRFSLPTMVVPTLGSNPFLVMSNTNVCGFNTTEDRFMFNNFVSPINDKRYEIKISSWVRFDDVNYADQSEFVTSNRVNSLPKILVILYATDVNSLALSFYCYNDETGFVNIPSMTVKMEVDRDDYVTTMEVYGSLASWDGRDIAFKNLNLFIGTGGGYVLQKRMENEYILVDRKEPVSYFEVTSVRFVSCNDKSVLVVFSYGNYLTVVDLSGDGWNVIESISDAIVSFSIDAADCLLAYSTSFQNRTTFVDLYNFFTEKVHYLVPKPPFCILSLERDSKWAIVIRNYIRVLQVIHPNTTQSSIDSARTSGAKLCDKHAAEFGLNGVKPGEKGMDLDRAVVNQVEEDKLNKSKKLRFKSISTLNGHFNDITQCVHDGWSKLVTIDTSHNLFVWDYTIGCKIFSFSLVADIDKSFGEISKLDLSDYESRSKRTNFKRIDSRSSVKSETLDGCQNSSRRDSDAHRRELDLSFSRRDDFKRSVNLINRIVSNSETKKAIQDMEYFDDSDIDKSPLSSRYHKPTQKSARSKNSVPASNIKGLLDPNKKGQKYHVDVSVQSLIVYYKSCNVLQAWSFK